MLKADSIYGEMECVETIMIDGEPIECKRLLGDIGLSYEELKEKVKREDQMLLSSLGIIRSRMTFIKDNKVVESFVGYGYVNGKFYGKADKIIFTHSPYDDNYINIAPEAFERLSLEMIDNSGATILEIWKNNAVTMKVDFSEIDSFDIIKDMNEISNILWKTMSFLYTKNISKEEATDLYHAILKRVVEDAGAKFETSLCFEECPENFFQMIKSRQGEYERICENPGFEKLAFQNKN